MDPIEEDIAWERMRLAENIIIGVPPLCCTLSPHFYIEGGNSYCIFCTSQICSECRDRYAYDGYNHHEKCRDMCPHSRDEHDSITKTFQSRS